MVVTDSHSVIRDLKIGQLRSPGTVGCLYGRPGATTVKRREDFQFKTEDGEEYDDDNDDDEVQNSLVVSFVEGSITGEEFPTLNEEYESGE